MSDHFGCTLVAPAMWHLGHSPGLKRSDLVEGTSSIRGMFEGIRSLTISAKMERTPVQSTTQKKASLACIQRKYGGEKCKGVDIRGGIVITTLGKKPELAQDSNERRTAVPQGGDKGPDLSRQKSRSFLTPYKAAVLKQGEEQQDRKGEGRESSVVQRV